MAGVKGQSGGKRAGSGRKKGTPNLITTLLKDKVLQALDEAGGVAHLVALARENPNAFSSLLGRILPTQVTGPNDGPLQVDNRYSGLPDHVMEMINKK